MKIPLYFPPCKNCNSQGHAWIDLNDNFVNYKCSCGNDMSGALNASLTIGFRGLYRSEYELNRRNDHILSIVFSALAFEWEITRLHKKWIRIEALKQGEFLTADKLEAALKKYRTIYEKIRVAGDLLHPDGFEKFAKHDHELSRAVMRFPSLSFDSLIKDFGKVLFEPRNRILHNGIADYEKRDAIRAYNVSYLGMVILRSMDDYRRRN